MSCHLIIIKALLLPLLRPYFSNEQSWVLLRADLIFSFPDDPSLFLLYVLLALTFSLPHLSTHRQAVRVFLVRCCCLHIFFFNIEV